MRILLVEDDRSLSRAVSTILQKNNYSVDCVENGQTALDYLEKDIYDAVIMDIMMPVMDGITATKTIRAMERQDAQTIPIIAMKAKAIKEDEEKCMAAGMNAHLAKPLEEEKVVRAIYENITEKRS